MQINIILHKVKEQTNCPICNGKIEYKTAEVTQSKPLDILLRLIDNNKISFDDVKSVAI